MYRLSQITENLNKIITKLFLSSNLPLMYKRFLNNNEINKECSPLELRRVLTRIKINEISDVVSSMVRARVIRGLERVKQVNSGHVTLEIMHGLNLLSQLTCTLYMTVNK